MDTFLYLLVSCRLNEDSLDVGSLLVNLLSEIISFPALAETRLPILFALFQLV
jgi:hypothetical protein